jgi:hypothetical protein
MASMLSIVRVLLLLQWLTECASCGSCSWLQEESRHSDAPLAISIVQRLQVSFAWDACHIASLRGCHSMRSGARSRARQ